MYTAHELYGVVDSLIPSCSGQVDEVLCSTALNQRKSYRSSDYKVCLFSIKPSSSMYILHAYLFHANDISPQLIYFVA